MDLCIKFDSNRDKMVNHYLELMKRLEKRYMNKDGYLVTHTKLIIPTRFKIYENLAFNKYVKPHTNV